MHLLSLFGPALEGELGERAGQFALKRMRMYIAHRVRQFGELRLGGLGDARIRMASGGDREGAGQVEIFFAVRIPHMHALGTLPDNRPRAVLRQVRYVAAFVRAEELEVRVHQTPF